jgi:GT2 family glycosyltransferase
MTVSVMIATRNRAADLRRTCKVLGALNPAPMEIMITADGCEDDTVAVVKSELPEARLIVNEPGRGSVASRDRMMREARGDLVLALDDDSYPEQLDCVSRIVPLFEQNEKLAIMQLPQRSDEYPESLARADFGPTRLVRSFFNSGAVLRRSIYTGMPGFEPRFFHMYEEPDYALQCIGSGYEVLFTPLVIIRHHFSGRTRNELRNHHRHARNEFWSILLRCPFPLCLALVVYRAAAQFRYACKRGVGWAIREPVWWAAALAGVTYCLRRRKPIPLNRYMFWFELAPDGIGM